MRKANLSIETLVRAFKSRKAMAWLEERAAFVQVRWFATRVR